MIDEADIIKVFDAVPILWIDHAADQDGYDGGMIATDAEGNTGYGLNRASALMDLEVRQKASPPTR